MYWTQQFNSKEKIHIHPMEARPSPERPRERRVLKAKSLEAKYEAKLEFPRGRGSAKKNAFPWGSMDIFWDCTM